MPRTGYRHSGRELRLTERQRQILDLIAKGRTNPEIAGDLGISLDGAKWHVSEVLARLNVATREEAADLWRTYNRAPSRLGRLAVTMSAFLSRRWVAATLSVLIVGLAAVLVLAITANRHEDDLPVAVVPTETESPEPGPTSTPGPLPGEADCPVDPEICSFAREREALLQAKDYIAFLTPSPYQRSGDIESFTSWLDGVLPPFEGWKPEVVSIGCPVYGDPAEASCEAAFVLAFSTLDQASANIPAGLGEFLYRLQPQDGTGVPELRAVSAPSDADREVILEGGSTVSTRDFQVADLLPGAVRVAWYPLDRPGPPTPPPSPRRVTGLFRGARPSPEPVTANIVLGESPYPPYVEGEAAVYDTATGRVIPLGPGQLPLFSPDGSRAAFVASGAFTPGEVIVVDLATGVAHLVGRGSFAYWVDAQVLAIKGADGEPEGWTQLNVDTGESRPAAAPGNEAFAWGPRREVPYEILELERVGQPLQRGGNSLARWLVAQDGVPLLEFEAYGAVPQSATSIVVATEPDPATLATNLFSVDIGTGQATFLVSALASSPNWPLSAFGPLVMWTDRYCPVLDAQSNIVEPTGDTWLFDSATGTLTRLADEALSYPTLISESRFALGEFGNFAIVDIETFAAEVVLPTTAQTWTADYRYAATGTVGGHGGLC